MRRTVRSSTKEEAWVTRTSSDVVGVIEEDDGRAHETVVGDGAIGAVEIFEEADGLAQFDPGFVGVKGKREP